MYSYKIVFRALSLYGQFKSYNKLVCCIIYRD